MKHRIKDTASELIETTINANTKGGWKARIEKLEKSINLDETEYNKSKKAFKNQVSQKKKRRRIIYREN